MYNTHRWDASVSFIWSFANINIMKVHQIAELFAAFYMRWHLLLSSCHWLINLHRIVALYSHVCASVRPWHSSSAPSFSSPLKPRNLSRSMTWTWTLWPWTWLAHCCTIFIGHFGIEIDERHRYPNINIRETIWMGNQLGHGGQRVPSLLPLSTRQPF